MTLAQLNATDLCVLDIRPDHNPTVLDSQTQLQAIWDGEYDAFDTITALRNVAAKLNTLATAIATERYRHQILTTTNESLQNAIATLNSIYDGEYDAHHTEKELRHLTHNLTCLRNLLIQTMYSPQPDAHNKSKPNKTKPRVVPPCPRCQAERIDPTCPNCQYHSAHGLDE